MHDHNNHIHIKYQNPSGMGFPNSRDHKPSACKNVGTKPEHQNGAFQEYVLLPHGQLQMLLYKSRSNGSELERRFKMQKEP
jgi:threonine dehydrogenase-like Zn-dependent dehydrogenase